MIILYQLRMVWSFLIFRGSGCIWGSRIFHENTNWKVLEFLEISTSIVMCKIWSWVWLADIKYHCQCHNDSNKSIEP